MSDEVKAGSEEAVEESVFEIVDEAEEAPKAPAQDDTVAALAGLLKDTKATADAAAADAAGVKESLATGFASLGDSIRQLVASGQAKPGESPEDFEARLTKQVFDKPLDVMREVTRRETGPINEQIVRNQMRQGKKLAFIELEELDRGLFKKYEAEVDAAFERIPIQDRFMDPEGAYQQAFVVTKARHVDEIVKAEVAKATPKAPVKAPYGAPEGTATRTAAPTDEQRSGAQRIVLKAGQRGRIEGWMKANNVEVTPKNFENIVSVLHERGELAGF
jgi:hypothetical protein